MLYQIKNANQIEKYTNAFVKTFGPSASFRDSDAAPKPKQLPTSALVDTQNILQPPFHVKLGIIKNFVKAMGKSNFNGFALLFKTFSSIRQAKLQEGIFAGSRIREVLKNPQFEKSLSKLELCA